MTDIDNHELSEFVELCSRLLAMGANEVSWGDMHAKFGSERLASVRELTRKQPEEPAARPRVGPPDPDQERNDYKRQVMGG